MEDTRFKEIFDRWADEYDQSVYRQEGEYAEVFAGYDQILAQTIESLGLKPGDVVLDIGAGTGNLSAVALGKGYRVIAVEPNQAMRERGKAKYPELDYVEGSFLNLPFSPGSIQGIVSSYAFHHLTDEEKGEAARLFHRLLSDGGRVVISDTMYEKAQVREELIRAAQERGFTSLAADLQREFYTTHEVLRTLFERAGFSTSFQPMNRFVWILSAVRV